MNWQRLFSPHILDRGLDYYQSGFVECFESGDDYVQAKVLGSESYDILINMPDGKILNMHCDCPYAEQGDNCKHMVAVLFFMDEAKSKHSGINQEASLQKISNIKDSVSTLVKDADEKIVRDFLSTILKNDKSLYLQFKHILHCEISVDDMKLYKNRIDSIFRQHVGRDGYISYYEARSFVAELKGFLEKDVQGMIETRHYEEAFKLTTYLLVKVGDQDMDDSDGGMGILAEICVEIWQEILGQCDIKPGLKRIMFEWCVKNLRNPEIDYIEDYIERILFDAFHEEEFVAAKLEFTGEIVSAYNKEESSWSQGYRAGKWAIYHINLMKENNFSENKLEEYCREYLDFDVVREYYIQECIEKKDYQTAINLLKQGKAKERDSIGLVIKYSLQLKQLYKQMENQKGYENELWLLMVEYKSNDIDLYKELRSIYSETEWLEKREIIFGKLLSHAFVDDLYEEEQLYDRLLNVVLNSSGLYKLMKYEMCLKVIYPNELLEKYEITVRNMAINTSDRKRYQELVYILKRMQKYSGGSEIVSKIASDWKITYKKRSAMMDELSKL